MKISASLIPYWIDKNKDHFLLDFYSPKGVVKSSVSKFAPNVTKNTVSDKCHRISDAMLDIMTEGGIIKLPQRNGYLFLELDPNLPLDYASKYFSRICSLVWVKDSSFGPRRFSFGFRCKLSPKGKARIAALTNRNIKNALNIIRKSVDVKNLLRRRK